MGSHWDADGEAMISGAGRLSVSHGDHVVLFYQDDDELAARASEFLLDASHSGGAAIVIATPAHRRLIADRLARAGFDIAAAQARGSYLALDAAETMRRFVAAKWPSPASFWQVMSPLIRPAAEVGKPVHIFGEMVSLLWEAGLVNAAIDVEAMWNELGRQYSFSRLCAYPARAVSGNGNQDALTEVCRAHAAVVGAPPDGQGVDAPAVSVPDCGDG
jgi:MEDS: MEthanogen/methylotroph, DcmR Sensory domain